MFQLSFVTAMNRFHDLHLIAFCMYHAWKMWTSLLSAAQRSQSTNLKRSIMHGADIVEQSFALFSHILFHFFLQSSNVMHECTKWIMGIVVYMSCWCCCCFCFFFISVRFILLVGFCFRHHLDVFNKLSFRVSFNHKSQIIYRFQFFIQF